MTEDALFEVYLQADAEQRPAILTQLYPLVRAHVAKVIWITMRESAQDFADQVANEVLQAIPSFQSKARFSTWVYAFAKNQCFTEIARRKRVVPYDPVEMEALTVPEGIESPYTRVLFAEVLTSLTPAERELVLARIHGDSHKEIAERLGITDVAVRSRWFELTTKLRRLWGNENEARK